MNCKVYHSALSAVLLVGLGYGCGVGEGARTTTDAAARLIPKEVGGKYGYIDSLGNTIIEPQFDYAYPFSEGRALVMMGKDPHGKYGYIDPSGKLVVPVIYDRANGFSEGLASVGTGDANGMMVFQNGFIDPDGQVVIPLTLYQAGDFHEGLALYAEDHNNTMEWGFIDKSGKVRIPAEFDTYEYCGFRKGLAPVRLRNDGDEIWGFIDRTGDLVIPFQYELSEIKDCWAVKKVDGQELAVQMGNDGNIVFTNGDGEAVNEEYLAQAPDPRTTSDYKVSQFGPNWGWVEYCIRKGNEVTILSYANQNDFHKGGTPVYILQGTIGKPDGENVELGEDADPTAGRVTYKAIWVAPGKEDLLTEGGIWYKASATGKDRIEKEAGEGTLEVSLAQ